MFDYQLLKDIADRFEGEPGRDAGTSVSLRQRGPAAGRRAYEYLLSHRHETSPASYIVEPTPLRCVIAPPDPLMPSTVAMGFVDPWDRCCGTLRVHADGTADFDSVTGGVRTLSLEAVTVAGIVLQAACRGESPLD